MSVARSGFKGGALVGLLLSLYFGFTSLRKFTKRVKLDDEVTAALEGEGWTVLRFWESDVRGDPDGVANPVEAAVRGH